MQTWKADLLCKKELLLGEGAIWHPGWQKFLYVDIENGKVGCIDPTTKETIDRNVEKKVGTVVPIVNGKLIVALQGSIEELDFETGKLKQLTPIENCKPHNRCNEGKCDAKGRLWIGTMHTDSKPKEGGLYVFDGTLKKMIDNTSVSNGICWSNDHQTMYYIDSFDFNIKSYDFNLDTGEISNEKIIIEINNHNLFPDGMCIDDEGMLWVAMWGGGCINRYNPFNGELIGKVFVNAPHVTSCAFGGNNMQQLFITTARVGLAEKQLLQYALSGSLFIVNTNITGVNTNYFNDGKL